MTITTDFECGGGKRLTQLAAGHWRVEVVGDGSGYDKYFCVQVTSEADEAPQVLRLELHPDSELAEPGAAFFESHFPSNIWCCGADWRGWRPLRNTWEDSVVFHPHHIELRAPIAPGTQLHVATNPPLRYSDLVSWAEGIRQKHGDRVSVGAIGRSVDGRDIPVVRLPKAGARKLLVLAGQHPSEHCGNWACEGIVEYALSSISDARDITGSFDVAVIPMVNPDGNVRGLSGANAEGINLFSDFTDAAEGNAPKATENRLLWSWIASEFPPDVILHFHGYMGWRVFSHPPYDGVYFLRDAETLYATPDRLAAYRTIQDRLIFETPAYTSTWSAGQLAEESLEHQLALRFGTLSAFYEINSGSVGAFDQFRRGPQVLSAVVRALLRDVPRAAL